MGFGCRRTTTPRDVSTKTCCDAEQVFSGAAKNVAKGRASRDTLGVNPRRLFAWTLLVPALTVGLVGWLWFQGRVSRPHWSARLWVATSAPEQLLLRSQMRRFPTGAAPGERLSLELEVRCPGHEVLRLNGQTTPGGESDWQTQLPSPCPRVDVNLRQVSEARSVLRTELDRREMSPPLSLTHPPTRLMLRPSGDELELELGRGALAVPFSDELEFNGLSSAPQDAVFDVELSGATLPGGETKGRAVAGEVWTIVPTEHVVEVGVSQRDARGVISHGFAILPVVPGAMAAHMNRGGTLEILAPVPRDHAHVAVATLKETLTIATVDLVSRRDVTGRTVFTGSLPLPESLRQRIEREQVWAVTSSEFDFGSEAQLGSPLSRGEHSGHSARFHWGAFVDSAGERAQMAEDERWRWRWLVWGGLFVACGLELALISAYSRRALGALPEAGMVTGSALRLVIVYACVALAFAGLGALFLW